MSRPLRLGDIVYQSQNGGWWWMRQKMDGEHLEGVCLRPPPNAEYIQFASTSMFEVMPPYNDGVELVPDDEVPPELWGVLGTMGLLE